MVSVIIGNHRGVIDRHRDALPEIFAQGIGLAALQVDVAAIGVNREVGKIEYVPVLIGDVVDFRYIDTDSDEGISARCMVQTIQMTLSPGTKCTYTLKEVSQ